MKKYFINGHTSEGPYHLLTQFSDHAISVITGGSMELRGNLLKKVANHFNDKENIDIFVHPNDGQTIDGLLFTDKKILLLADNQPLLPASKFSGLVDVTYDVNECVNSSILRHKNDLFYFIENIGRHHHSAYKKFAKGREVHEEKEKIYLSGMSFSKADSVAEDLIEELFTSSSEKDILPNSRRLFFGAATAFGPVNYINEITEGLEKRIIIKGRSGSGKSTLMRKITAEAEKRELSVDYFPCALDPGSLDMVIVPSLSFAIIDGTAPHIIDAERSGDKIVDMFELCIDEEVEKQNLEHLNEIDQQYKAIMKEGTSYLFQAHETEQYINELYKNNVDEDKFQTIFDSIRSDLEN